LLSDVTIWLMCRLHIWRRRPTVWRTNRC